MTSQDVTVLIVDDQLPFRDASRMVVEMTDGFTVVAEADNGERAIELVAAVRPDLVLMDVWRERTHGTRGHNERR